MSEHNSHPRIILVDERGVPTDTLQVSVEVADRATNAEVAAAMSAAHDYLILEGLLPTGEGEEEDEMAFPLALLPRDLT